MLIFYLSVIDDVIDQTEFERLYDKYSKDAMRLAISIVRNYHDAEDICQEAWLCFSRAIKQIRSDKENDKKAYILKIVKNKSLNFLRAKDRLKKHIEIVDTEEADRMQGITDATLAVICRKETVETIHRCLSSVKESLLEILILYYLDNLKVQEIAREMKLTTSTVYKRLEAGRSVLIKMLVEKGEYNNEEE